MIEIIVALLEDNTTALPGESVNMGSLNETVIQVIGLLDGDAIQIQGSNEPGDSPTTWVAIEVNGGTSITDQAGNGLYPLDALPKHLRAERTSNAGGGSVSVYVKRGPVG